MALDFVYHCSDTKHLQFFRFLEKMNVIEKNHLCEKTETQLKIRIVSQTVRRGREEKNPIKS